MPLAQRGSRNALLIRLSRALASPPAPPVQGGTPLGSKRAERAADGHQFARREAIELAMRGGVGSDCLTDMWLSSRRLAFVDLSAGPFQWGPAVGGEGVRTLSSLPDLQSFTEEGPMLGSFTEERPLLGIQELRRVSGEQAGKRSNGEADLQALRAERALLDDMVSSACALVSAAEEENDSVTEDCSSLQRQRAELDRLLALAPSGEAAAVRWSGPLHGAHMAAGEDSHDPLLSRIAAA
ncbi:MAG: hypothetical protein SGPRY_001003, partial [Prymnesium sp.]